MHDAIYGGKMSNKLVGLIGPGIGPRLSVKGFSKLKARVRGLVDGCVEAIVEHENGCSTHTFVVDGDLELPCGHWLTFKHQDGKSVNLLCIALGS